MSELSPGDAQLLGEVSQHYQRQLAGDDPAGRQFLRSLGIGNQTLAAFDAGYSDGGLWSRTGAEQREALTRLGLFTHNHKETLGSAIVFPARDPATGATVDLHAVKLNQNKPANLSDPPRGLLQFKVLHAAREIVLTDTVLSALRIFEAGFPAVIPLRGAADLENNFEFFREKRPELIWLSSYRQGAAFQPFLERIGCAVRRLKLPKRLMDITAERLKRDLAVAETGQDKPQEPSYVEELPDGAVFEHLGCRFRVTGIQETAGGGALRVILTASSRKDDDHRTHVDRLDLLSAAGRKRFAKDAQGILALSADAIEDTLLKLIDQLGNYLEERRRKQAAVEARHQAELDGQRMVPEERKEAAFTLLKDPKLLDTVLSDLETLGLVGESENALLLFLVAISRKLPKPLGAILRGESAGGKSNLAERIVDLIPAEDVLYVSRLSPQALFYMPPGSLKHRLLLIEERAGSSGSDYAVRALQSKGMLTMAVPLPPDGSGQMRTRMITVEGPVAYVETTTDDVIDPQNLNRCFELYLDESSQQTRRILKDRQRRRSATHARTSRGTILARYHDMQRLLAPAPVLIPFAEHLRFPDSQVRFRRDHERFLGLIDASALLHQHQREWRTTPRGERVILAGVEDYAMAYRLCRKVMAPALDEISTNARAAWEVIVGFRGQAFTRRQLMEALQWSFSKTYRALRELLTQDLLVASAGRPIHFTPSSFDPVRPDLKLISPEDLANQLSTLSKKGE